MSRGAAIVGYFADGTAAVRTADGDYPAYDAPQKAEGSKVFEEFAKTTIKAADTFNAELLLQNLDDDVPKGVIKLADRYNKVEGFTGAFFTLNDYRDDYIKYGGDYEKLTKAWVTTTASTFIGNAIGNISTFGTFDKRCWLLSKVLGGVVGGVSGAEIKKKMRVAWRLEGEGK